MKIYTRKGDQGETGLIGGTRVMKDHARIEAYGTLDELNSFIGVLRDSEGTDDLQKELIYIQEELFTIGSHLANDPETSKMVLPALDSEIISKLENWMDSMDEQLEPMRNFVLPGGHLTVSHC
ncbi:MAG: cob(I)yrinic acid a,c-diamide adenosyltransferase, partial [Flavobacteriales bacterium]|nr:cob(I)yrinic acid a,c-diamide adenosyltransferase [Flavobacteriales bacterium]